MPLTECLDYEKKVKVTQKSFLEEVVLWGMRPQCITCERQGRDRVKDRKFNPKLKNPRMTYRKVPWEIFSHFPCCLGLVLPFNNIFINQKLLHLCKLFKLILVLKNTLGNSLCCVVILNGL